MVSDNSLTVRMSGYGVTEVIKMQTSNSQLWSRPRTAEDIGAFVAELRRDSGLTQAQLAQQLDIPRRAVYEIEAGKSTQYVDRLLAVLNLLGGAIELTTRARAPEEDDW